MASEEASLQEVWCEKVDGLYSVEVASRGLSWKAGRGREGRGKEGAEGGLRMGRERDESGVRRGASRRTQSRLL